MTRAADVKKVLRRDALPVPTNPTPLGTRCVCVTIPDSDEFELLFYSVLQLLGKWNSYQQDGGAAAAQTAQTWREVLESAEECMAIQFRTNPFNNCSLEVSFNGGIVWTQIFNAAACAIDNINDSLGNNTPTGGATPEPDQCFDLDLIVEANSAKIIPLAIEAGWTLKFTDVQGAWNDGSFLSQWACPTGKQYSMGSCGPVDIGTRPGDPIPTAPHMQLIIRLADGSFSQIPLDGSDYVIPAGTPNGNTMLLSNDAPLNDNMGSVSLHVNACNTHKDVTWQVQQGSGPSGADIGQEVTLTSDNNDPNRRMYINNFSSCFKFTVISTTGYSNLSSYGYCWNGLDCADNFYYVDNAVDPCDAMGWDETKCVKSVQFQSGTPFTITIRVDELC